MAYRLPTDKWKQPNNSDKFGNVWRTKNINFDLHGYAKLSPRLVRLYSATDDADFGLPIAIGRQAEGEFQVTVDEANWSVNLDVSNKTIAKDVGSNAPSPSFEGDGAWFEGLWHVSTDTAVLSRPATGGASQAYTSRITGLTSGKRHIIEAFKSAKTICVSNGNVVKQYTNAYNDSPTDLTVSTDFEISGLAYNNDKMGVITRLANNGTVGQDQEAQFFLWSGGTTGALGYGLGSDAGIAVKAYKSSYVVLTRAGELLYFNGNGFQQIATFPFFFTDKIYGDAQSNNVLGQVHMEVDGDIILIHIGNEIEAFNKKEEKYTQEFPAGIWCYDPNVGLYHRYSLSNSPSYLFTVTHSNINTSTDVLTISSGTLPQTGNIARLLSSVGIGGLTVDNDYYIVKLTDTTFKLAETREKALAGVTIDITSATAGSNYFWVFDHKDYGTTRYDTPGAVKLVGNAGANNTHMYTEVIAGGRMQDTDLTNIDALCIAVPRLENKGYIVTPRFFSQEEKDTPQKIVIRYRPLNSDSEIRVYGMSRDVYNVPVTTVNVGATWTGLNELYTTRDISEAKTHLDNGGHIHMEIISGSGAGNIVKVTEMNYDSSTGRYSLCLKEDIFGVTAADKCEFILYNLEYKGKITSDDNGTGEKEFGLDLKSSKFAQLLIELRGYDIILEDILYVNGAHKIIS